MIPRGERPALTGLRALAALWVLLFHLHLRAPLVETGPLASVLAAGAGGMTLFFALSGFVLGLAYRGPVDLRAFLRARAARLYPLYGAAALLTLPWLLAPGPDLGALAVTVILGALMLQAWFPQLFGMWNNPAAWSLSVEAAFYALFPALRAALAPLRAPGLWAVVAGCVAMAALLAAAHRLLPGGPGFAFAYANPAFRVPEFLAGLAAARLCLLGVRADPRACAALAVAAAAALASWGHLGRPMDWTPLLLAATVALLMAAARAERGPLTWGPVLWLGRASYAIYLMQFPVILGLPSLAARLGLEPSPPAYWAAALALTVALAALAHHGLERPARARLARAPRAPRPAPTGQEAPA